MNWIGIITTLLTVVNILICLLLIFVVLLQRPKSEGLGAAFGGDTASNLFGAQTTNVLANLTRWLGGLFLGLCFLIAILGRVDPGRKAITDAFVQQKAEERRLDEEKKKAEAEAQKAADLLKQNTPAAVSPAVGTPAIEAQPKAPEAPKPGEAPAPAEAPKPGEAPKSGEAPKVEPPKPAEGAAPAPAPAPAPAGDAAPKPEAPKPDAPKPAEGAAPEAPAPAGTPAPAGGEAPKPQ